MSHKSEIVLLATDMEAGDTIRELCPSCGGGSTSEKSLSITRSEDGSLVWQCFRGSCTEKGTTDRTGNLIERPSLVVPQKPKAIFTGQTESLSKHHLERIHSLWGITEPEHWYWTKSYGGRVAMSIRSPKYLHRGWVLRDIWGNAAIKALNYPEPNEELLSWYKTQPRAGTVLVEDIPSTVRVSAHINSCALLGTGVGLSRAMEISNYATRPIVLALDQDATLQSFKIMKRYQLLWEDVKILPLAMDFKDMTEEELCESLQSVLPSCSPVVIPDQAAPSEEAE